MRILFSILLLSSLAMACGTERWEVKTTIPKQGSLTSSTVEHLTGLQAPTKKALVHKVGRYDEEQTTYMVVARLVGFKKEADGDYHLVLAGDSGITMVAEIPDPACTTNAALKVDWQTARKYIDTNFGKATAKYKSLRTKTEIFVVAPFFFDFIHGQTGVAKNGAELHPVIRLGDPKSR